MYRIVLFLALVPGVVFGQYNDTGLPSLLDRRDYIAEAARADEQKKYQEMQAESLELQRQAVAQQWEQNRILLEMQQQEADKQKPYWEQNEPNQQRRGYR